MVDLTERLRGNHLERYSLKKPKLPKGALKPYARIGDDRADRSEPLAILSHARTSTGDVAIFNTHPHYKDGLALVHNGVVDEHGLDLLGTTCDSAGILWSYIQSGVRERPSYIKHAMNRVCGWYACIVLGKDKRGPYVDVWRSGADLWVCYLPGVGIVWCTKPEQLQRACQTTGDVVKTHAAVKEDQMLRVRQGLRMQQLTPESFPYEHNYWSISAAEAAYYSSRTGASIGATSEGTARYAVTGSIPHAGSVCPECDKGIIQQSDPDDKGEAVRWCGSCYSNWDVEVTSSRARLARERWDEDTDPYAKPVARNPNVKALDPIEEVRKMTREILERREPDLPLTDASKAPNLRVVGGKEEK
jgi:hypothetical protein